MDNYDFPPARVKAIRVALGLTQAQFARRIGCTTQMVSFWERNVHKPMSGPIMKALLQAEREAAEEAKA